MATEMQFHEVVFKLEFVMENVSYKVSSVLVIFICN